MTLRTLDIHIIHFFRKISDPFARIAFFIIFFWFGALKVVGLSPAHSLVQGLFEKTISFMNFGDFMVLFGLFECLIGILFLFPRLGRVVMPLLLIHMGMTFMPLILVPGMTWSSSFVPTLEGQYIIKNLALIGCALGIMAHLHPIHAKHFLKK
jgi:uncharacterized membrane protein YkgB